MSLSMMHGSMFALWWIIAVTLMVGVAVAVVALTRTSSAGRRTDSLDALRERYAAGDIDDEEYRRRRRMLQEP